MASAVDIEHIIDLSIPCELPFDGAQNISPAKSGVVKLERRDGDLFVNGEKINLFLSDKQKVGTHGSHELREILEARRGNQSAKILDHLKVHPELWPEDWKKDAEGRMLFVFFWDDIFRHPSGIPCVRYGYWGGGRVVSSYRWIGFVWGVDNPAASVN